MKNQKNEFYLKILFLLLLINEQLKSDSIVTNISIIANYVKNLLKNDESRLKRHHSSL